MTFTLIDFLILLADRRNLRGAGQVISGTSRGGILASIALGFIGALFGVWLARLMELPEPLPLADRRLRRGVPGYLVHRRLGAVPGAAEPAPRAVHPLPRLRRWRAPKPRGCNPWALLDALKTTSSCRRRW